MSTFTQYLTEAAKSYDYKVKVAGTIADDFKNRMETALQKFRDGDINLLCSTKALNQGLDVPTANMGIICGLTSKSLSMIQRVGRTTPPRRHGSYI